MVRKAPLNKKAKQNITKIQIKQKLKSAKQNKKKTANQNRKMSTMHNKTQSNKYIVINKKNKKKTKRKKQSKNKLSAKHN